jgi:pimeloyl-ACP methyl ester carboxylesterase
MAFGASFTSRQNFAGESKVALLMGALFVIGLLTLQYGMPSGTMLILRGIASAEAPRGQLDDNSAKLYALRSGYGGKVLDVAGGTAEQVAQALDEIRGNPRVAAIYGFSGGAFATVNIWNRLTPEERARIRKIVIVGAPGVTERSFPGASQVVIQPDPPEGHMEGPRALLNSWK